MKLASTFLSTATAAATATATTVRAGYRCSCHCQLSHLQPRSFSTNSANTSTNTRGSTSKPLIVLGIESSADDSSCSIVSSTRRILGLSTISQHAQNSNYGGIHPLVAQRAHAGNIPKVIERALSQAKAQEEGFRIEDVDAIAYTRGPGMKGCLAIGEMAAKGLAAGLGKRVLGIHHMQAHALTPLLTEEIPPKYPFLILLVSGGHTQLVLASGQEDFQILLDTLDSKIGDVFEKAARLLRLPAHPSKSPGAVLEQYASSSSSVVDNDNPGETPILVPSLPVPLSTNDAVHTRAFSFAGILSALERKLSLLPPLSSSSTVSSFANAGLSEDYQKSYSRAFQKSAVKHLTFKISQAINDLDPDLRKRLDGLVVSGGVASNLYLRDQLQSMVSKLDLPGAAPAAPAAAAGGGGGGGKLYYPPVSLCTDNAAMIAWAGILRLQSTPPDYTDSYDLPLRPKWSLEQLYDDIC